MLGSAEQLCFYVLGHDRRLAHGRRTYPMTTGRRCDSQIVDAIFVARAAATTSSGSRSAPIDNEPVVHVFSDAGSDRSRGGQQLDESFGVYRAKDESGNWVYPVDHPVGNQHGDVEIGYPARGIRCRGASTPRPSANGSRP